MRTIILATVGLFTLIGSARAEEQECPVAFQGAKVAAAKVHIGVTLEFRNTNLALVPAMREQLREVAEMLEQHGTQTQTTGYDDDSAEFPPVDLEVKDITNGARVTVGAARLRDIPAVRELAFGFAEFWKSSPCVEPTVSVRRAR